MKTLTLFFTYGTSLEDWAKNGSIDREINVYKKFLNHFDKIYFITYGKNDSEYADKFPKDIVILPKKININNALYSLLIPFAYKKELKESDWLKTNQMMGSWSAVLAKLFFRKKLALRAGYTESLCNRKYSMKIIINIIERISYKLADVPIITTREQADYLKNEYGTENINVVPNGIDLDIFKKPTEKTCEENPTKFLFVGRLNKEKNLLNMVRAFSGIANVNLRIIGEGELKDEIIKLSRECGIRLEIVDSIPNSLLPQIYGEADIYIQPSLYEGNPKTILEAMACGRPIIASNVSGINNLITHKKNGYLCEINSDSIKKAVLAMISDGSLRRILGSNARKYMEDNYDLNRLVKKEMELYEKNI